MHCNVTRATSRSLGNVKLICTIYYIAMIEPTIRQVWADNLSEEMARIGDVIERYNYVSVDTEFPGVVARPIGEQTHSPDYMYQTLRINVDLLNIIQLGISLADIDGKSPPGCSCWQFNFRFNLSEDLYAQDAIELLTKAGLNFPDHERSGIDLLDFGEQIMSSGLVLNPDTTWVSFHSAYDFAYLVKILTCLPLPPMEAQFLDLLHIFFPSIFDVKHLMQRDEALYGGLNRIAELYNVPRIGINHQAGSDSLLTLHVFFEMKQRLFSSNIPSEMLNVLCGLGVTSKQVRPMKGSNEVTSIEP